MSHRDADNIIYSHMLIKDEPEPVKYICKMKNPTTGRTEVYSTKIRIGEEWLIQEITKALKLGGYKVVSFKPAA